MRSVFRGRPSGCVIEKIPRIEFLLGVAGNLAERIVDFEEAPAEVRERHSRGRVSERVAEKLFARVQLVLGGFLPRNVFDQ